MKKDFYIATHMPLPDEPQIHWRSWFDSYLGVLRISPFVSYEKGLKLPDLFLLTFFLV